MGFFLKNILKYHKTLFILFFSLISFLLINKQNLSLSKSISNYFKSKFKSIRMNEELETNEDNSSFESNVNKICKKASSKLQKYYETYDTSLMDVSYMSFEQIEYYPDYIQTLFDIIESKGDIKDNLLKYLQHAAASFMFIILGVISVVAWLFFYFYCCCNCCCCCCCKKEECKFTFLFVPLLFDFMIVISCLAGILSSNKMFTGFADVECSLMKFISEINTGEKKENATKWLGFEEISNVFENIKNKINKIKTDSENILNTKYDLLNTTKYKFPDNLKNTYKEMLDPDDPDSPLIFDTKYLIHIIREGTLNDLDVGVLDILYNYGPINKDEKFLYQLFEQYEQMTKNADIYLKKAHDSFIKIFQENSVSNLVEIAQMGIEELNSSVNNIKDEIAKYVIDYSDPIESYGKYIVKIIFVVILSLACFSGFSVVMMYVTTQECCYGKCCCGKGFTKTLSHISWNLMSLVMICSFVICGLVFLLSYIGKDLVQVITIIFGEKNLYSKKPILIKGNVSDFLSLCFHGDGDLGYLFGFTNNQSSTYEFDELNKIMNDIDEAKKDVEKEDVVIKKFKEDLENRKKYIDVNIYDFNTTIWYNLDELIIYFNDLIKNEESDVWTLNNTCPDVNYLLIHCPEGTTVSRKDVEHEPVAKECLNFKEWKDKIEIRYHSPIVDVLDMVYITVLKAANYYVNAVNNITDYVDDGEPIPALDERIVKVEDYYNEVINLEKETLNIYNNTIHDLISVFNDLNNEDESLFSFLNCQFMGNNTLIILKNLKGAFSKGVQSIGLSLVFASFGMLFSIIFTLLEIIVLKVSLYLQKRRKEREEQITLALGVPTKVATFNETDYSEKRIKNKRKKNIKINNFET